MKVPTTHPIVCLLLFVSTLAFGQVKIGDNPSEIHPKALLQLESHTKAFMLPRLTTEERDNFLAAKDTPKGAVIFNMTSGMLEVLHMEEDPSGKQMIKTWTPMQISHSDMGNTMPTNPMAGDLFYSTETHQLMVYDGEQWREFQSSPITVVYRF